MRVGMLVALAVVLAGQLDAQQRRRRFDDSSDDDVYTRTALSVMVGPSPYELAGTGTGAAGAVRIDVPSGRYVIFEPGVTFFHYNSEETNNSAITYVITELSVQVQAPSRTVRPYVGVGAGFTEFLSGRGSTYAALHAAAGLRLDASYRWGARLEARLRAIDPFKGHTTDLMVGVSRRLGGRR